MKRKAFRPVTILIVAALVCCSLIGIGSAAARFAYFRSIAKTIVMTDDGIRWAGEAMAWPFDELTDTEVYVRLQVSTSVGWGTVDSDRDKVSGLNVGAGGTYADWQANKEYRVAVEAWCYNGDEELEYVGPFYEYLTT